MEVCIIYNFNVNPRCLISTDFRNHIISPLYLLYSNKNGLPYYYYLKDNEFRHTSQAKLNPLDDFSSSSHKYAFGIYYLFFLYESILFRCTKSIYTSGLSLVKKKYTSATSSATPVNNHHFKWWFIISPPKGYCYCSPQRAVSQAPSLVRYKAVLLESSFLDSSACSFIYF